MKSNSLFLLFAFAIFQSCISLDTPQDYFDRTTLSTNAISDLGKKDFEDMKRLKEQNAMRIVVNDESKSTEKYEEYVKTGMLFRIGRYVERINDLKPTEETEDLIKASLEVFNFVKSKYENEYIEIAKMMDNGESEDKINKKIEQFEKTNLPVFYEKMEKLTAIAIPYAESNGINVKFY